MDVSNIALISMHTDPFAEPGSGDVGGMNVVVKHAGSVLAARGRNVEIYIRRSDEDSESLLTQGNLRLHRLPAGPAEPATKRQQEEYLPQFTAALKRAHADSVREGRPWQVIHSHHWFSGAAALDLAAELGIPHVQSFHSIAAREAGDWALGEQPEGPGRVPAEARLAERSAAIIAVSGAEARTAIEIGADRARVHTATPGVDQGVFHREVRADAHMLLGGRPTFIVAARLEPLKGIDLAIGALARIPGPQRPRLVVTGAPTGGHEGYDHTLHRLVKDLRLTSDVWFSGPMSRADLAAAMAMAHGVLVPSHSETYGLVALEAAACGTPVLGARVGGLVDAVVDGVSGILIDGRDPNVWAHHMMRLVSDQAQRERMGAAASRFAAQFTWESMVDRWEDTYRSVR